MSLSNIVSAPDRTAEGGSTHWHLLKPGVFLGVNAVQNLLLFAAERRERQKQASICESRFPFQVVSLETQRCTIANESPQHRPPLHDWRTQSLKRISRTVMLGVLSTSR